jgi:DNA ligase-1
MITCETIFKVDSKGKVREWRMEIDGANYRTVAGIQGGQKVISGWKEAHPKNVGRSNATTAEQQAIVEVDAKYTKKLDGEYHETLETTAKAKFFKPMLATKWEDLKDGIDYPVFTQPKLDGVRCVMNADGMFSRTGKAITSCPHIIEELAPIFAAYPDAVLDGELYNHDLRDDFNKIISLVRKTKPTEADTAEAAETVQYHLYDSPTAGDDYMDRYLFISTLGGKSVKVIDTLEANSESDVDQQFGEFVEQGYEGGMIRVSAPYEQKRSKTLMKRKDFEDMEFEIISIEEGQGNWAGLAKRVVFRLEDGRECGSGLAGNREFARKLLEDREDYVGGQVTVQYFTRTPDNVPRFPIAKALYVNQRDV